MRGIRIGILVPDSGGASLDAMLAQLRAAEADGFASAWIPNIFGMCAITLCALAGRETSRIELGTAVVPTHSRHPMYAAQQALTAQAACAGRFALGLGPSHKVVIEGMLGLSYAHPARHVEEYLRVVTDLVRTGKTSFAGELYRVSAGLSVACPAPPPVLIGALGPRMRQIAGAIGDGTITWMAGRRAIGEAIAPGVRRAAREAGRPEPRIAVGIPIALASDAAAARAQASKSYAVYATLPSYRAMLEAEGVSDPGEIALVGDEQALERGIRALADAGATDFQAAIFGVGEDRKASVARTRAFLAALARG